MRIRLGELRRIVREVTAYHGSHAADLARIIPDPTGERSFNGIGTWFTSVPERARMYGPNVYEVEMPEGRWLTGATGNFMIDFYDSRLAKKHLGTRARLTDAYMLRYFKAPRIEYGDLGTTPLKPAEVSVAEGIMDRLVFSNKKYLADFVEDRRRHGYIGVLWKDSTIDTSDAARHDVYLSFDPLPVVRRIEQ